MSRPCMFLSRTSVSMVRTIMTGATRVATELNTIAAIAAINGFFSAAKSGRNFLPDSRSDRLGRGPFAVSSVYFIVACAALGIVELDIFRRCLHQLLVSSHGQNLAFHEENN